MDSFSNVFGFILLLGVVALIVVVVLYIHNKTKARHSASSTVVDSHVEVIRTANGSVNLDTGSLKAYLTPIRNDEPLFMRTVTNLLESAVTTSEIAAIRIIAKKLEAKNELLITIDKHEEQIHALNRKKEDFKQRDEMQDLKHDRDKRRILNDIELLKNPPPPPPSPPPPKSQAERKAEDKRRKEAEAARHEAEVKKWRKELSEDPNFGNEDIETEIERRKRARGWLDSI